MRLKSLKEFVGDLFKYFFREVSRMTPKIGILVSVEVYVAWGEGSGGGKN